MRIAVYGGSFNPPHPAHVRAARLAYEALQPDKLLIIPAADPPHKQLAEGSPDPQERFELTRIAFRGFPEAEVSDMELVRGGESYTSDTVAELAAEYPGAEIFFVIGTDMLTSFERWHNFRDILALSALASSAQRRGRHAGDRALLPPVRGAVRSAHQGDRRRAAAHVLL